MSFDPVTGGPCYLADIRRGACEQIAQVRYDHTKWEKPVEQKADDIGKIGKYLRSIGTVAAVQGADALERLSTELRKANGRLNLLEQERDEACAENARLSAERDAETKRANEQTDLATKSIRRLAELAEPGAIGAFASRDHWKVRAEAAEASRNKAIECLKQARARIEYLGAACFDSKHFEANAGIFLPAIDEVLSSVGDFHG